jgi:hypothetical protein
MNHIYLPIVGLAATLLIACQSPSVAPTKIVYDFCDLSSPILILKSEIPNLSLGTKQQILAHNKVWKEKCSKPNSYL